MSNIVNFFDYSKIIITATEANMDIPKADIQWSGTYSITDGVSQKDLAALSANLVSVPTRGTALVVKPTVVTLTPDSGTSVAFSAIITAVTSTTVITVDSAYELSVGQSVTINSEVKTISDISGLVVTLTTALSVLPEVNDVVAFSKTVIRPEVYAVSFTATSADLLDATHLQFNIQDGFTQTQSVLVPIPKGN